MSNYYVTRRDAVAIVVAAVLLAILLLSCYNVKKAQVQFVRASVAFPEIPADYCARVYPPKHTIIIGKDSIRVDTLWGDFVIRDTVIEKSVDTVRIYYTTQLPGKVITRTIERVDTIYQDNSAALDLCSIERGKALTIATDKTKESDKWKKIARQRFWIIASMGGSILLWLIGFIRKKIK